MKNGSIQQRADYLAVDCATRGDVRDTAELYRAFAVECVTKKINRVLVKAADCDRETHYALRDALTVMLLAGIPAGFRLAMVTGTAQVQSFFLELRRDLERLSIQLALFADEAHAVAWLQAKDALHARAGQRGEHTQT